MEPTSRIGPEYISFIESVKNMSGLVGATYKTILTNTLESKNHILAIDELTELIKVHNQYINTIKANNFCKTPILQVQKQLNYEFEQYCASIHTEPIDQLDAKLCIICQLGEKYAHKTKFTVMNIPVENLILK